MTDPKLLERVSRTLSLVLRHDPASVGLRLDSHGWVEVERLIRALNRRPAAAPKRLRSLPPITRELLEEVVASNDKQRFALTQDGTRIRAAQGHSVEVDLGYPPVPPPEVLYHGTYGAVVSKIRQEGLKSGDRHDVHLSSDPDSARRVGARRGPPVILVIQARRMHEAGHVFRQASNGVWLVREVPPEYLARA